MTNEIVALLKDADKIYLEGYTSPYEKNTLIKFKVQEATREFVEDGRKILDESASKNVVLISYGDPMVATTHMELRVRAEKRGISTNVLHNSSILSAISGETGLHSYKFGKTVTAMRGSVAPALSLYFSIHSNLVNGLHSIILLEYDHGKGSYLSPNEAMNNLVNMDEEQGKSVFGLESLVLIASRIGNGSQSVIGGSVKSLSEIDFGDPPHVIILPGELHFTEEEALRYLLQVPAENIRNNSKDVKSPLVEMPAKYIPKAKTAMLKAREKVNLESSPHLAPLFANIEAYISDSERFLNDGKQELAILSIGYAEGLLDALRFIGVLDVEW